MRAPAVQLILGAMPAVATSFFVLSISDVGRSVWIVQGAAVLLMLGVAAALPRVIRSPTPSTWASMAGAGVLLCALPLLGDGGGPQRWVTVGPISVYVAPVVVPALLALAAHAHRWGARSELAVVAALSVLAIVLACQPDLSQVLALSAGSALAIAHGGQMRRRWRLLALLLMIEAIGLAAVQPDTLLPVPHVEQVIAMSWRHSMLAGLGVSTAALLLVVTVAVRLAGVEVTLAAVAAYYSLLFACSIADLTPAPLIGYGAGPLLGLGLLAGIVTLLSRDTAPASSTACGAPLQC